MIHLFAKNIFLNRNICVINVTSFFDVISGLTLNIFKQNLLLFNSLRSLNTSTYNFTYCHHYFIFCIRIVALCFIVASFPCSCRFNVKFVQKITKFCNLFIKKTLLSSRFCIHLIIVWNITNLRAFWNKIMKLIFSVVASLI